MGGLLGGKNTVEGVSPNTSERAQRFNFDESAYLGGASRLAADELNRYALTGRYDPRTLQVQGGRDVTSGLGGVPQGPAWDIMYGNLAHEANMSNQRNQMAGGILSNYAGSAPGVNAFNNQMVGYGSRAQGTQEQLFGGLYNSSQANQLFQNQLLGQAQNYLTSGGAPSSFQSNTINDIYGAQRDVAMSNLNKTYEDSQRDLGEWATTKGLNKTDTPILDRAGKMQQEYMRNVANIEAGLGGQQANAMLQMPFQQNQSNLGAFFNTQGSALDMLNAFTTPIQGAFNAGNSINAQGQFGMQYSPATYSTPAVQNFQGYLGGGAGYSNANPLGSFQPVQQTPTFGQTLGQSFGSAMGSSLGQAAGAGATKGVGGLFNQFGTPA